MAPISLEGDSSNHAPTVGIIYPPPELRNIVDKTASFVARNGPEFEQRIKQNEINNPKFNFLNDGDPYHAYYEHKVKEIREGKDDAASTALKAKPTVGSEKTPSGNDIAEVNVCSFFCENSAEICPPCSRRYCQTTAVRVVEASAKNRGTTTTKRTTT